MKNAVEQIKKHLGIFKSTNCYYWIAGGSIMSFFLDKKPNDIDFFFENEEGVDEAVKILRKRGFHVVRNIDFGKKLSKDDLERLFDGSDEDLAHDVGGINSHIDRKTKLMDETFVPRCMR